MTMTLSEGYRQAQSASHKQPCLDYPYLGFTDEDEEGKIVKSNGFNGSKNQTWTITKEDGYYTTTMNCVIY